MRVPSGLIEGNPVTVPILLVIWVKVLVVVLKRKISPLPSGLPPIRSAVDAKAMWVPSALIEAH